MGGENMKKIVVGISLIVAIVGIGMAIPYISLAKIEQGYEPLTLEQINNLELGAYVAKMAGRKQVINAVIESNSLPTLEVYVDIPAEITFTITPENSEDCTNIVAIPKYGIHQKLVVGENVIKFTPKKLGVYQYSCETLANMGVIIVIE